VLDDGLNSKTSIPPKLHKCALTSHLIICIAEWVQEIKRRRNV